MEDHSVSLGKVNILRYIERSFNIISFSLRQAHVSRVKIKFNLTSIKNIQQACNDNEMSAAFVSSDRQVKHMRISIIFISSAVKQITI